MLLKNSILSPELQELVDRKETIKQNLKPDGVKDPGTRVSLRQELTQVKKKIAKMKNQENNTGGYNSQLVPAMVGKSTRF